MAENILDNENLYGLEVVQFAGPGAAGAVRALATLLPGRAMACGLGGLLMSKADARQVALLARQLAGCTVAKSERALQCPSVTVTLRGA